MQNRIYIGFDLRMPIAYCVAAKSAREASSKPLDIRPLVLPHLQAMGLYTRPTSRKDGLLFDEISQAPMSTEFALSRFLVPHLSNFNGWSIFCDSDFMFRSDIQRVFELADPEKAVMVVKHKYAGWTGTKMDRQAQTAYERKNWSSFILFNCAHKSNKWLTPENVNAAKGLFLHGFRWLDDNEIGELDTSWNWLEGHGDLEIAPDAVHFTRGLPDMAGYEFVPYAEEWKQHVKELKTCK